MNAQGKQYGRKSLGSVLLRPAELSAKEIAEAIKAETSGLLGQARSTTIRRCWS